MLAQKHPDMLRWRAVPLARPLSPGGPREEFLRARWDDDGLCVLGEQHSGAQAPLAQADWLIRRRPHAPPVEAGQLAMALPF
jgi:molybdopterin molybdotransferase